MAIEGSKSGRSQGAKLSTRFPVPVKPGTCTGSGADGSNPRLMLLKRSVIPVKSSYRMPKLIFNLLVKRQSSCTKPA